MSNWMKLRTWLRGRAASARAGRAPRVRLRLETLEERLAPAANSDFRGVIGLDSVQANYSYRGAGYSVAILDTGINYNDPNLGGGWGKRVIAGWNFVANDSDPMDDNGHGTFVASEIASSSVTYPGVAPDVNLIALKVLNANDTGTWTNIQAGLQWVISNLTQYNIVAINLSLGSGNYTTDDLNILESDLATLKNDGVFISVASGNNFASNNSTPGLAYPAVDPDVVSVGATWAGSYGSVTFDGVTDSNTAPNEIADFTQRDASLSLLAPGAWITGDSLTGGYTQYGGTSMAAAIVTGAAVIIHEALVDAGLSGMTSEADILNIMQTTGTPIKDDNTGTTVTPTGLTFRQLNLYGAVNSVAALESAPTLAPIANQTIAPGGSTTVPLSASDPSGAPYTLTAQLVNLPALAYQINQELGLSTTGSYYLNKDGMDEKWLLDRNRNWYFILPDGEFRRWTGSVSSSMQAVNLIGMFNPSYYANPMLLWYTPYVPFQPINLSITGNTLTIQATSATWTGQVPVLVTASNGAYEVTQTFNLTVANAVSAPVTAPAQPPVLGALPNLTVKHSQNPLLVALSATDPAGRAVTFSAQILPTNGQTPPVTATVSGSQLSLSPAASFLGTYSVSVTASDGLASSSATFTVTVTDTPPQLAAIPAQSMSTGQNTLTVPLSATDADGDTLTYTATVLTPSASLYQLQQQLGLHMYGGSYYTNEWGYNEKWLVGANGTWYGLFPNGQLYRWAGLITTTMQPANLVATLDPSVYANPELLWNAQPPVAPAITLSVQGNTLTLQRQSGLTGVFQVQVTAGDGATSATQTFYLTLS